jgi:hypothetical protein
MLVACIRVLYCTVLYCIIVVAGGEAEKVKRPVQIPPGQVFGEGRVGQLLDDGRMRGATVPLGG